MKTKEFKEVVFTLFEKHYHYGVAALINSLCVSKFDGLVVVGYKGNLPTWITQFQTNNKNYYSIKNLYVEFLEIDTILHFGYYKPTAILNIFQNYPSVEKVFYFDPDIIVKASWDFYSKWINLGVCLCLDNNFPFVHHNHPWRQDWINLSNSSKRNKIDYYVNSGFIGVNRANKLLIERWISLTNEYQKNNGNLTLFEKDGHRSFKGDQDLLNAAITVSPEIKLSIIGKEGMGFSQPAYLMSHAINNIKPWEKNFLKYLILQGIGPDFADKDYMAYANFPIKVFSNRTFKLKKLNLKLSSFLGRLIG
ncbi:hypothetical protein [Cyclobacterium jeungdonense]|uniref:Uncharacterized protein n=1 Tax=Cyclobacterium jeungdonense TaxID=708087 RepID=A0ABT8CBA5_9BACT|nr:hypothetical protein [Cyclobacterium jeungdonense]MDN3688873.1 hypothetical protein [Cyclobacterium jeungdonense]